MEQTLFPSLADSPGAVVQSGRSAMSCFPRLWRSSAPPSPGSPVPPSPGSPVPPSPGSPVPPSPGLLAGPASPRGRSGPRSPPGSPGSPGPGSPRPTSPVECSICFNAYDNTFKTPKVLRCSHVFCLECVARLSAALPPHQPQEFLPCPFCRQLTQMPRQGAPGLATSKELLATLPPEMQQERPLWMEGTRLCCRRPSGDAESAEGCVSVDVAVSKAESAEAAPAGLAGRLSRCELCDDWKRVVLLSALLIILFCIVLWPVQCALKTGNLRCFARAAAAGGPELLPPKGTATAAAAAVTRPALQ
ncbi:RING finger protein 223 [Cinclus cinclus]|uniref:RING finger protein 223 n=1 Tax=Cinclus cinclus TaxID=127875 RepID=UPI002E12E13D